MAQRAQNRPSQTGKSSPDSKFALAVIAWQREHGRHSLPWQDDRTPYRVWLSEIMLQQTQVATVIPYYENFLSRYSDVVALANAPTQDVMSLWAGLGYYSRARNLHKCAQQVRDRFNGEFPADMDDLISLPGIGESTAAAIAVFAFGQRQAIMDGNVKRVFARQFGVQDEIEKSATINQLWDLADKHLPGSNAVGYTQGLMDLGATCCTRSKPNCEFCPVSASCVALATDKVSSLPVRRKKKPVPQRETTMLVFCRLVGGKCEVFVEPRPQSGIWAGLFSLPESTADAKASLDSLLHGAQLDRTLNDGATADTLGCSVTARLAPIAHAFTHYRLNINPVVLMATNSKGLSGGQWLGAKKVSTAALPAPVKKLIQAVLNEQEDS
jgi:A/G-specific adenine glycosylase